MTEPYNWAANRPGTPTVYDERDFETAWRDLRESIQRRWEDVGPFKVELVVREDQMPDFFASMGNRFTPKDEPERDGVLLTDFGPMDVRQTSHGPRLAYKVPAETEQPQ